jgi:ATP-binding cassette subfamily F protein uup
MPAIRFRAYPPSIGASVLLRLDKVSLAYGSRPLLDQVSLQLDEGERVGLVGRNGEGKSSLLRLVLHEAEPDAGSLWVRPGARVAHLAQDIAALTGETVAQIVTGGLPQQGAALAEYQILASQGLHTAAQRRRLDELHHALDAGDGWQLERRVESVSSRLQLDPAARFDELSGGWRRRALLARALVSQPDILLLDEPTNHLDIEAIEWLEQFLLEFAGALLFVSHDRAFINRLATRIVELDRGTLSSTSGNYDDYARVKTQQLAAEAQQQALFDKKLAQEEVWIRKGVEARRTRNEGRVRALYQLRAQRRARRERTGSIELEQRRGVRCTGVRGRAPGRRVRRPRRHSRFLRTHHAQRSYRAGRAQRCRQDHAHQGAAGRNRDPARAGPARQPARGGLLRPGARPAQSR